MRRDPRRGGRPAQALLDAPAAAVAEQGAEAQRQHRAPPALGGGEEAVDEQLEGALEPAAGGPFGQLDLGGELLVRAPRAQRRLLAAGEAVGAQPGRAEAVGDPGRGEGGERLQGDDAEPPQGLDEGLRLALAEAEPGKQRGDGQRGEELVELPRWDDLVPRAGAAAKAAKRVGATPIRTGIAAARRAASTTPERSPP